MLSNKKKKNLDDRLYIALEKLFYKKSFITEIEEYRKKIGMPEKGYTEFNEYYLFLKGSSTEENLKKQSLQINMVGDLMRLGVKYKYPTNYVYWIEAFLALGYNYKKFESQIPFNRQRQTFIYGMTCNLEDLNLRDDFISFSIYPGATFNSVRDFLKENWGFIKTMLEMKEERFGKSPTVRKSKQDDRLKILKLWEEGKVSSDGVWLPGIEDSSLPIPECLLKVVNGEKMKKGMDVIRRIIIEERAKKQLRNAN